MLLDCRAKCHSAVLDQASARNSGAGSEQELLSCPSKEPCCTSILAYGAQHLVRSHSIINTFVPFFFLSFPPSLLYSGHCPLSSVNRLPGKRVITNARDAWCLCSGKAAFSLEQAVRWYPIPCVSEVLLSL